MSSDFDALRGGRMDEAAIDRFLEAQGVGVLSMAADGVPYGVPLSFGYDGDGSLYFAFVGHSEERKKVSYAERSSDASFLAFDVASGSEWRSVIVTGPVDRVTPDEWDAAREAMADNAFRPDLLAEVDAYETPEVWALDAEEKSGRAVGVDRAD